MIVVPYTVGAVSPTRIAAACEEYGGVTLLVNEQDRRAGTVLPMLKELAPVVVHRGDVAQLVEHLAPRRPDGVVTFADSTMCLSAALAAAFELPHNSPQSCEVLRSKLRQRRWLNDHGIGKANSVPFVFGGSGPVSIDRSASFPAIVKPDEGAGSEETLYVASPSALQERLPDLTAGRRYVIEEYLPGGQPFGSDWLADYLSVESAVSRGLVRHLGMSARMPLIPPALEAGAVFPVEGDEPIASAIAELAERAIRAVGLSTGLVHTEIKLTPEGPQIIEINGRLGGGMSRLIPHTGMVDPVRLAVDLAVGRALEADFGVAERLAMLLYVQAPVGATVLEGLPAQADLRALPGLFAADRFKAVGDDLDWHQGSFGRIFDLWVEADSLTQLQRRHAAVLELLERTIAWR